MSSLDSTTSRSEKKIRCSNNVPVYFTGLSTSVEKELKFPRLCVECGNYFTSSSVSKDALTESDNFCSICCDNFGISKKKDSFSSNSYDPNFVSSASCSSVTTSVQEGGTPVSGKTRRCLLPSPTSTVNYQGQKYSSSHHTNVEENGHLMTKESSGFKSMKRKLKFEDNPVKKHRPLYSAPNYKYNNNKLSSSIWQLFWDNKQTETVFEQKMNLRNKLHDILLGRFPNCGLYVVGSSMTGLGANSSDMDMCLMLTDDEIDQKREARNILHKVQYLFCKYNFLVDIQVIYAKVPILRFKDIVSGIEVDLNVNNAVGIRNTQLLLSYARIDERLPPLVVLAKLWARHHGINDAKNNTLSSYSLVLMMIHYLQYGCTPCVLPSLQILQPDKFLTDSNVRDLKLYEDLPNFTSDNPEDLGTLFIGFLKYFAMEYNFNNVMSVRLGSIIPKDIAIENTFPKSTAAHWKMVCIEEPFDLTNTARAVFKPDMFHYIKQVFKDSWTCLRSCGNIESLFC